MLHPDLRWMAMHMTVETFFTSIRDSDGTTSLHSEQCCVNLQTDVFASTECSTNSTQHQPNILFGNVQAIGDLLAIFVQPLSGDVHL